MAAARVLRPLLSQKLPVTASSSLYRTAKTPASSAWLKNAQITRSFSGSAAFQVKKFTQDHEWIELSDDGKIGTIGITTYASTQLGDVVYVELPSPDTEVAAGDSIGAVESVKSASDIMSPVSGRVVEANEALEASPKGINKEGAEGEGWVAKIELSNVEELEGLMDEEGYKAYTEEA